jgi:hypothetical protein
MHRDAVGFFTKYSDAVAPKRRRNASAVERTAVKVDR